MMVDTWLVLLLTAWLTDACHFPDFLQTPNTSQPWHSHVRHDRSRSKVVLVQINSISIRDTNSGRVDEWNCTVALKDRYVIQQDQGPREMLFACVQFHRRSKSIVQVAWSSTGNKLDPDILCADSSLIMDPWPLIAFHFLESDFSHCSLAGGYNMKINDSSGQDNPCNLMDLPMRLESECLAGDGVTFNFRSSNCLSDLAMHTTQNTICVASWSTAHSHFSVLRRHNDHDIWCLRIPRRERRVQHAVLFSDLACVEADTNLHISVKYLNLFLRKVVYSNLCEDEYPECADMPCNSYIRKECMKACRACDPRRPPAICSYPRDYRGAYTLVDRGGTKDVEITESILNIQSVGKFQCMVFPGSPISSANGMYSTVSLSENGCRPRYTCVQIKRLGPSVLSYSLSQSLLWPTVDDNLGAAICNIRQFQANADPISDLYRSHYDSRKPVIAQYPRPIRVDCNLTSAYTIQAKFANGPTCHGSMYEDCKESSRLRMDFTQCKSAPLINEYKCIAVLEGQYWEKIVLIQNTQNENDARCIVFNHLRKLEALVLKAGECDKFSWRYAKNNVRKALVTLQIRPDMFPCKNLPKIERTTSALKVRWHNDPEDPNNPEDLPRSILVTVDPSPRVLTARPSPAAPSRPQTDDTYHHVNSVYSGAGPYISSGQYIFTSILLFSGYLLS